jgi:hypothetical protein
MNSSPCLRGLCNEWEKVQQTVHGTDLPKNNRKERENMASLLKRLVIFTLGLLIFQMAPVVHAQGKMGMMMGRQMMMNSGMMGMNGMMINPNLAPNLAPGFNWNLYGNPNGNRAAGSGGYGGGSGGGYGGYVNTYPSDDFGGDNSYANSQRRKRHYREREVTLSPQEERERIHQMELAWSQGDLTELETQSATALNILLADLRELQSKGIQASDVSLDKISLGNINVLVGRGNGNSGLLKNGGRLNWPQTLQGREFQRERDLVNNLVPKIIEQARRGHVADLSVIASASLKMHEVLHNKIADIPTPEYVRAKRFLTQLDDAIRILREPDAANYFNQLYSAQGRTAAELVQFMTRLDMRFAPAVEGDAASYLALHRILAAYDRAAHDQLVAKN